MKNKYKGYSKAKKVKESLPKASALLLVAGLLFILFNVVLLISDSFFDKQAPQAMKGELDLSAVDLDTLHSLPLAGNWAFYWQTLRTPAEINAQRGAPHHIEVPHAWVREYIDGKPMARKGAATYHLKVKTDKVYSQLAMKVPSIGTAYKLYIDDNLVAKGGKVSEGLQGAEPSYNPTILLFEPHSKVFTVTVQVSNHHYYWGGIWRALRLSVPDTMQKEQIQHTVRTTFLLAIFLTVALFNLIQFTLRAQDPLPILIALTCLLLGLREMESTQVMHYAGITDWSFITNTKINFLTFYVTSAVVMAYFHLTFRKEYNKYVMKLIYTVTGGFSLLVLVTPPDIFSPSMPWFQGFTIVLMPYVVLGLIQAVRNHRRSARMLMLGTIFLFVLILNDILYNLDIIDSGLMVSFGLVAFIFCQNYLTYIRFINDSRENEVLSVTLEQRNKELEEFSQSLEDKVKLRTDELAKANERLEELAHKDMLTGLPNRRGMKGYIEEVIVQFWQKNSPFCLLLIDFDKFKVLNDTLGHEAGDKVLVEGARIMRQNLRDQDQVARWGGEEFLLLLPGTPVSGAEILADKLRNKVREHLTELIEFPVSITIGVAEFQRHESLSSCLKRADAALYEGKNKGRDRVVVSKLSSQKREE